MEKLFYTISEAADAIGESVSLVRFWSDSYPKLFKPKRTANGKRQYTAADIDALKQFHFLVKEQDNSLDAAARIMSSSSSEVDRTVKALESLKAIRSQLVEIKKSL